MTIRPDQEKDEDEDRKVQYRPWRWWTCARFPLDQGKVESMMPRFKSLQLSKGPCTCIPELRKLHLSRPFTHVAPFNLST